MSNARTLARVVTTNELNLNGADDLVIEEELLAAITLIVDTILTNQIEIKNDEGNPIFSEITNQPTDYPDAAVKSVLDSIKVLLDTSGVDDKTRNTLLERIESQLISSNSQLDSIDEELVNANSQLDSIDEELVNANSQLVEANSQLDSIDEELVTANSQILGTNLKLDSIDEELISINGKVASTNVKLMNLDTKAIIRNNLLTEIESNQLPDNHQVTVSNLPDDYPDAGTHSRLDFLNEVVDDAFGERIFEVEAIPDIDDPVLLYFGQAPVGTSVDDPNWEVKRVNITETSVTIRFAKGIAWSNRATELFR